MAWDTAGRIFDDQANQQPWTETKDAVFKPGVYTDSNGIIHQNDDYAREVRARQDAIKPYSSYAIGGSNEAYARMLAEQQARGEMGFGQERITPDGGNFYADMGLADQSMGGQAAGLGYYNAMASGSGPNAGLPAYRQAVGDAMAQQQSMAASSRGGAANAAAARRLADQQRSALAMGAVSQQDALRAQAQTAGMAGYASGANAMRQGTAAAQGLHAQWAQDQANAGIQQQQQDLQNRQYYANLQHQTRTAQQQGMTKGMLYDMGQAERARQLAAQDYARQTQAQATALGGTAAAVDWGVQQDWGGTPDAKPKDPYKQKGDW